MTASEMLPHSVSWLTHSWEVTAGGEGAHAWGEKPQICNILTNQPEFRKRQKDFIRSPEALKFDIFMMENTLWKERIYWSVDMPAHLWGDKEGRVYLGKSEAVSACLSPDWMCHWRRSKLPFFGSRRCGPEEILQGSEAPSFSWRSHSSLYEWHSLELLLCKTENV